MDHPLTLTTNSAGVWHARAFDGTEYSLVPWGSLRKLFASVGAAWNGADLGIVGSIAEAQHAVRAHETTLPYSDIDPWTGEKVK